MPFTEPEPERYRTADMPPSAKRPAAAFVRLRMTTVAILLAGCSSPLPIYQTPLPERPVPPSAAPAEVQPPNRPDSAPNAPSLQPAAPARNWNEYRLQAAQRLIAANPGATYLGEVPQTLLAIPVLEIEVNADGSVRSIQVLRYPRQAKDTTQTAIDAVHRAAPFGNVGRLPRPWRFAETFLFNDARQFKPRSLD